MAGIEADRTPGAIIDTEAMRFRQWLAVAVAVGLNALDGIDVLSISYAAPGISAEWHIGPALLGWVLSIELIGAAAGSIIIGNIADRIGRRPTMIFCLVLMGIGMIGAGHATAIYPLLGARLLTGLGIGGMLPTINAATGELSNARWRSVAMAAMVIGYPLGGAGGGAVVRSLLTRGYDWRVIFELGAISTALFIPLVLLFVPETLAFLDRRQPPRALEKANRILRRFGHEPAARLASLSLDMEKAELLAIFQPALRSITIAVTLAYFAHMTAFYFLIKWTPKIIADMGFGASAAAGVLALANIGGAVGGALFGVIATRVPVRALTLVMLVGTFSCILWFGLGRHHLANLKFEILAAGFFCNAAVAGLYMLMASSFPAQVRSTGTGFVIGAGRGGAILAPLAAGYLFQAGLVLAWVALIMGCGSLLAAIALFTVKERSSVA